MFSLGVCITIYELDDITWFKRMIYILRYRERDYISSCRLPRSLEEQTRSAPLHLQARWDDGGIGWGSGHRRRRPKPISATMFTRSITNIFACGIRSRARFHGIRVLRNKEVSRDHLARSRRSVWLMAHTQQDSVHSFCIILRTRCHASATQLC